MVFGKFYPVKTKFFNSNLLAESLKLILLRLQFSWKFLLAVVKQIYQNAYILKALVNSDNKNNIYL